MGGKCGHPRPNEVSLSYGTEECRADAIYSPFPTGPMSVSVLRTDGEPETVGTVAEALTGVRRRRRPRASVGERGRPA